MVKAAIKTTTKLKYTDESGRNDFEEFKVCEDENNLYFFVKTVENITPAEGNNWMNLFIGKSGTTLENSWNGYNFVLNYKAPENDGKLFLGALSPGTAYNVTPLGEVDCRIHGNLLMLSIPKQLLGIEGAASIIFKWADNCTEGDVTGFYKTGDSAPIGRAGFYYGP